MTRLPAISLLVLILGSPAAQSQGLPPGCNSQQMGALGNNLSAQAICDYLAPNTKEGRRMHLRELADASPACYQKIMTDLGDQMQELSESVPEMAAKLPAAVKEWYLDICAHPEKIDAVGAPSDGR
jgi:hypothetical protein